MLTVGERLPAGALQEYVEVATEACPIGPRTLNLEDELRGKAVALFALPGAFTPTCSAKHLPGYIDAATEFVKAGVDEIWCLAVNDAFVMGAWGRSVGADGKVRMMADGSAELASALGVTLDLTSRGMGVRSQRYSALVVDGVVKSLNVEGPGKFEVSDAATLLAQAKTLLAAPAAR